MQHFYDLRLPWRSTVNTISGRRLRRWQQAVVCLLP